MNILISIKPEYAAKIYAGEKTIEFRTTVPRDFVMNKDYVFIYETAPVCAVTGFFKVYRFLNVQKIFTGQNDHVKRMIIKKGCLTMEQIKKYRPNLKMFGWEISEFYKHHNDYITRYSPSEKPPQSWCYTNAYICGQSLTFDHKLTDKSYKKEHDIWVYWQNQRSKELRKQMGIKGGGK